MRVGIVRTLQRSGPRDAGTVYRGAIDEAVAAEGLGYAAVLVGEHHFLPDDFCPSPLTFAAAVAARTADVLVGSCVTLLPLNHPLQVAEQAAVVDVVSSGRLVLGLGAGYRRHEFRGFGVPHDRRGSLMDEKLAALIGAWSGTSEPVVRPRPVQSAGSAILLDAASLAGVDRAARFGLSPLFPPGPLALVRQRLERYTSAAAVPGRVAVVREMHVAESRAEAYADCEASLFDTYRRVYRRHGGVVTVDPEGRVGRATEADDPVLRSEALVRDRLLVGDPDSVTSDVLRCRELGVTDLLLVVHHQGLPGERTRSSLELFAREVLPHVS